MSEENRQTPNAYFLTLTISDESYKKPSFLADVGAGIDDIYSGVAQGAEYVADGIRGGVNKVLGTNLDTNLYEKFTKYKADEKAQYEKARKESGAGMNVGRFVGQTIATLPVAGLSRVYGAVNVLSKSGLAITAQNAGAGALVGGLGFAENAEQRKNNVIGGAIGGAVGGIAGDKIGKGIAKVSQKVVPSANVPFKPPFLKVNLLPPLKTTTSFWL